jgi:hypothetical protein
MVTASSFTNSGLTDDEAALLAHQIARIDAHAAANRRLDTYYEGQARVRNLGIAIPPGLNHIDTVVGWPTMTVDVIEERLDAEGFAMPGQSVADVGLDEIWTDNGMDVESGLAHTDALIYGLEFVAVSVGDSAAGEPDPLITVEPPTRMTAIYDARTRRLSSAASVRWDDVTSQVVGATLYQPNSTIILSHSGGFWSIDDVQQHNLGRLPVVRLANRPRSGRPWGTSQISKAIISYTDAAVRTLLGMEVAREFYSSPQRYVLGADEDAFVGPDGNPKTAWEVYLGRFLALTRDENGEIPTVGQFAASSPAPYLDQVKGLASLVAAEASIPVSYLGFNTDNPPSADGIRSLEARLVKGAERRQKVFGAAWAEVMRIALLLRDGEIPEGAGRLSVIWRDASTPTKAASADRVMKLVSAGVLPPTSEVTYEELGFSEVNKQRLMSEARQARTTARVAALTRSAAEAALSDPTLAQLAATEEA